MITEIEKLIEMTPAELYSIQNKRRQENEKEFSRLKEFFRSQLSAELKDFIEGGKVEICESRIALSRLKRMASCNAILIDLSVPSRMYPTVCIILQNGLKIEVEMMIGYRAGIETRIIPSDTNEFQRLKTYLSDWESRSSYFPRTGEPKMVLFNVKDCVGKNFKEICLMAISEIKKIVSGDNRIVSCLNLF